MHYKTETQELPGRNMLYQIIFDSEDSSYFVKLYKRTGGKIKHCEPCDSEEGAMENMFAFISEMENYKK